MPAPANLIAKQPNRQLLELSQGIIKLLFELICWWHVNAQGDDGRHFLPQLAAWDLEGLLGSLSFQGQEEGSVINTHSGANISLLDAVLGKNSDKK